MRQIFICHHMFYTQGGAWVSQLTGLREESLKVKLRHCISLLGLAEDRHPGDWSWLMGMNHG